MSPKSLAGIALVAFGVIALIYQGFTYTSRETVVDIGPIHATADRERTFPLSPVVGVIALAGGAWLLASGRKRA